MGREREMLQLKQELGSSRLLTLTGAGGSGKTRLALEVARDLLESYPDGVWLAELAPLSEGTLVPKVVAEALNVPERPQRPLVDTLTEVLGNRELLLILDNCEHLVEATAHLVDSMLDSCPRLRVLATSREALGVEGEIRWLVSPLGAPGPQISPTAKDLEGYESARLFLLRARSRKPSFSLTPDIVHAVAEICRKLEGIPLALELAAARVDTLSLLGISERLGGSLELLTRGDRTAVARQRTLEGALDWSHDLLAETERTLFRRLSVFAGGCTLEASEAVGSGGRVEEARVLDLLSRLVGKSLVVAEPTAEGEVRYRLLEPIRQYALKRLEESGEAESVRERRASFFLALAEEAETGLWGTEEAAWLVRLEAEHDNLRAVLSWTIKRQQSEAGLRLAGALRIFWYARGHVREGRGWLEEALEKDGGRASPAVRAKALNSVGWLALDQGDSDRAEAAATEGINLSSKEGTKGSFAADFRDMLGMTARLRGDNERAKGLFEESLDLNREAGNKRGLAFSLFNLADVASDRGDHERAKGLYEEAGTLCEELGDTRTLPKYYFNLGNEYLLQGDHERATELLEKAVKLLARGRTGGLDDALERLGWAALMRGDHERAWALHTESLELSRRSGDRWNTAENVEGLACAAAAAAEAERAARLFGAAEALREVLGYERKPEERTFREARVSAARTRLGQTAWDEAFAEGKTMEFEEVVEYVLSQEEPSTTASSATPGKSSSSASEHPYGLTSREAEVLRLVAAGMTSSQVAKELFLSPRTVSTHLTSIYRKIGVSSRAAAIRFALETGLA